MEIIKIDLEVVKFDRKNWEEIKKFTFDRVSNLEIPKCIDGIAKCKLQNIFKSDVIVVEEGDYIVKRNNPLTGYYFTCITELELKQILFGV